MKFRLVFCTTALLACSSVAMASGRPNCDQQTPEPVRARRAQTPEPPRPPQAPEPARQVKVPANSFLGVQLEEVGSETVQRLKLRQERGALIDGVVSGSSAAQAGLQKNDVIISWDGEQIESAREMSRHIRETPAGRNVRLGVFRDGREIEVSVKMGERTSMVSRPVARIATRPMTPFVQRMSDRGYLGADLHSMTEQLAEYFGLSKRTGALVVFVFADSPAAKAGLKAGDVILNAGGDTVENPLDLRRVLTAKPQGPLEFKILRDKQEKTLTVQIEKSTRSWLLEPDQLGEADVRIAMAPLAVHIPKMKMVPAAIAMPRIAITPMSITMPKMALSPTTIQVPKIKLAPMVLPSLKLTPSIAPMKFEMPKIKIAPVNIVVVPRRIIL